MKKKFNVRKTLRVVGIVSLVAAGTAYGFVVGAGSVSDALGNHMKEALAKNSDILLRDYISE